LRHKCDDVYLLHQPVLVVPELKSSLDFLGITLQSSSARLCDQIHQLCFAREI
jgi:hypothetical protein